ncbi:hypothetical protein AWB93_20415 [Mycobacterium bohemicum]|uniref:Uncharacterized protein n=1 Tax=Mycobacterium bohemicum TaxID=56425 RepID=A0A1X1QXY0_MYCBE|nr:hypothetical protein AWB93_20415 [Mycobacterium bohemicum]
MKTVAIAADTSSAAAAAMPVVPPAAPAAASLSVVPIVATSVAAVDMTSGHASKYDMGHPYHGNDNGMPQTAVVGRRHARRAMLPASGRR